MADRKAAVEGRTWSQARGLHEAWDATGGQGWLPFGLERDGCGCIRNRFNGGVIWEPCMAHESDGHLCAISEEKDPAMHVARCLVLACRFEDRRFHESDAITAAQQHWRETANS
jgi:hypothetical protein